jgi:membrane protein YqaA with SNARE-associated domain
MSDAVLVALLGIVGVLLSGVVSFVLGRRAERHRQSVSIRAECSNQLKNGFKVQKSWLEFLAIH